MHPLAVPATRGVLAIPQASEPEAAVEQARRRLAAHYHFRHCYQRYRLELHQRRLIIHGRVPSYYYKQLLQEALRHTEGIEWIDNRVEVDPATTGRGTE